MAESLLTLKLNLSRNVGMRLQGKITKWQDNKGYGFITPKDGGKQVFVHIRSFNNRQRRPVVNEWVTFELKTDATGRPQANSVTFLVERVVSAGSSGSSYGLSILSSTFLAFVASAVFFGKLSSVIPGLYIVASVITFVAYAIDKSAAKKDRWRTSEDTLHVLALIGGWPGALVAQQLFRHKSKKKSFQIMFWITVVLNCGALGWLFSTSG